MLSPPRAAANSPPRGLAEVPTFHEVFAQYSPFVWRALARLGVRAGDVPDACQEAFLVVHRRLDTFDANRGSLKSWVYGICVRIASDYRRRRPNNETAEALASIAVDGEPKGELLARRAWAKLARVLERLDEVQREAFVLYELEGLPMLEVAGALGCPLQTAYSRLHAARRAVLAAFTVEESP